MLAVRYCFDTSVFINAWQRDYPPDVFGSLWVKFESMIGNGEIVAPEEVRIELQRKDDLVLEWAKKRPYMFVPIDISVQNAVLAILKRFPRLVETRKGRSGADPFVIGLAMIGNLTVVTYEKTSRNLEKPKIPDVCKEYDVECISLLSMLRRECWSL